MIRVLDLQITKLSPMKYIKLSNSNNFRKKESGIYRTQRVSLIGRRRQCFIKDEEVREEWCIKASQLGHFLATMRTAEGTSPSS